VPAGDIDVPGLLAGFRHAHPGVDISLREGVAAEMFRLLATDQLDVAFAWLPAISPISSLASG
jgi:DNA-binding transcriptional LysR family regulator